MINDEQLKQYVNIQLACHDQFLVWMQDNHPGQMGEFHWAIVDNFVRKSKSALKQLIAEPVDYEIALHALSGDYIRQVWWQKDIVEHTIRTCSICDYPIRYLARLGELYIDTSCSCTRYHEEPRYVGWNTLVNDIKREQPEASRKATAERYGFALL